ncbi:hypothetical protein P1J78_20205 [Psychromarinibacter sp. C21-152]|uniref:Periplasmic protein-like protein n=1 Tax=Psychromarinibacter sediminicola TaxID=3033385 RepID=A0AAE3NY38_9RHOB|nr:hypothetical protein [Psychromarinibacter sediminicola]MDF0603075.1 hypothetical protein [Psychromarinibacter sediminicola]
MSRIGAARAIKAILALQIGIAVILFGRDIARVLPQLGFAPAAPALDEPVAPGDQTRRYDPSTLPTRPSRPGTDLPATGDMPARLQFDRVAGTPGLMRLTGTIAPGDAERFADWLETTGFVPERVQLHSPGGSVTDALEIGRSLRALEAETEVASDRICLSACPYVLAAGVARVVGEDGYVGVHQHYFDKNVALPAFLAVEDIQRGQGLVLEYLVEMGIDPLVMTHALGTPPGEIYILVREELEAYRMVSDGADADTG